MLRSPRVVKRLGLTWLDLCNRHERLAVDDLTGGRVCLWRDTSPLTVAKMFPKIGGRLLTHCRQRWPISFGDPATFRSPSNPDISFVLGIRGTGRLPQFQTCLAALCGQQRASFEIIVVEQSCQKEFANLVPSQISYHHLRTESDEVPYNRSWALNYGVRQAQGELIVILDADMLFPERFAANMIDVFSGDIDAVRPVRLLFYLDEQTSSVVQEQRTLANVSCIGTVVQNTPNPIVIRRDAYLELGGHDESFFGWGGEDNEFISRLRTLRFPQGGFLPAIHLWHREAPKQNQHRNLMHLKQRLTTPAADRIRQLVKQSFGQAEPTALWHSSSRTSHLAPRTSS